MYRLRTLATALAFVAPIIVMTFSSSSSPLFAAAGDARSYVKTTAAMRDQAGVVIASLPPATPVRVISADGPKINIEVSGWSPMGGAKYIFKAISLRIGRATLTSKGVDKRIVTGTGEDAWESEWEAVTITGWVRQQDLVQDINAVWKEASALYFTRCSRCHSLRRPKEFTANQWPSILKVMTKRAGMSAEQTAAVTALLQYHGRNQNVDDTFSEAAAVAPTATEPAAVEKIVGSPKLAEDGRALFESANCNACHGDDAKTPIMPEYPKLAGQNPEYMFKQILDFKAGKRANDAFSAMKDAVTPLSEDDARAIAYWLSLQ